MATQVDLEGSARIPTGLHVHVVKKVLGENWLRTLDAAKVR
jgi:hypothetical protein